MKLILPPSSVLSLFLGLVRLSISDTANVIAVLVWTLVHLACLFVVLYLC